MDHADLVRRATTGDVKAFVELTRRFQHVAFGSALALVGDFQKAEDVVQDAFLAAWSALPKLADPAAFPGWLRTIVRHHAFRILRRREEASLPLEAADQVASDQPAPDAQVEQRQQAARALVAIGQLPDRLREPALLFFVHACSQQDIANFLDLPMTTVNNRLHAARTQLKERIITMMTQAISSQALPDDFAQRIGRLIETRGHVVDALFDPAAPPDILAELAVSDEANRRAVNVQVMQRGAAGVVRGVAAASLDGLPRGSTVLSSGRQALGPVAPAQFAEIFRSLAGPTPNAPARPIETGIKVIDVMCPLVAGGTLAIAGERGGGTTVVMEEIVRRVSDGPAPLTMFILVPPPTADWPPALEPGYSFADELRKEGYSEGTRGSVQSFFLRTQDGPWTAERLAMLAPADTVIRLSRAHGKAKIYPTVDVLASRSRLFEAAAVDAEHAAIAERVRDALAALWANGGDANGADRLMRERALKLQNYFTQPFLCAAPYHGLPEATVGAAEAVRTCGEILDGRYDDVPVRAFFFAGGIDEIAANPDRARALGFGPVTLPP